MYAIIDEGGRQHKVTSGDRLRITRGARHLAGAKLTYADLSMFQIMSGLRYAFPRAMARAARKYRRLFALHAIVQELPPIAAYLASPRRIPFNNDGIFRCYPELDRVR